MTKQRHIIWQWLILGLIGSLFLAACSGFGGGNGDNGGDNGAGSPGDDPAVVTAGLPPDFSAQVYYPPWIPEVRVNGSSEALNTVIYENTGITLFPERPPDEREQVLEQCNNLESGIGFMTATAFVLGQQLCNLQPNGVFGRDGRDHQFIMLLVRNSSLYQSVNDLSDLRWSVPNAGLSTEYVYALQMLREAGVNPGPLVPAFSTQQAIQQLVDSEVEFVAVYYRPPRVNPPWQPDQPAEPYADDRVGVQYDPLQEQVIWNDIQIIDARVQMIFDYPDIFELTRIVALSPPVPNEVIVFGQLFDPTARNTLQLGLLVFFQSAECELSLCNNPLINWTAVTNFSEASFVPVQSRMDAAGVNAVTVFGEDVVETFRERQRQLPPP